MDRLEKILDEKIWTTGGIKSGKDVGTAELRKRTIIAAAGEVRRNFVLVDTKHIDTILKAITDYVIMQTNSITHIAHTPTEEELKKLSEIGPLKDDQHLGAGTPNLGTATGTDVSSIATNTTGEELREGEKDK